MTKIQLNSDKEKKEGIRQSIEEKLEEDKKQLRNRLNEESKTELQNREGETLKKPSILMSSLRME